MDLSIVISLLNERDSLPELLDWTVKAIGVMGIDYEVILVDDGSNDGSWLYIEERSLLDTHIKGIKFRRNYGKSAALHCGFEAAKGEVVATMDADLQDSPEELQEMYNMIKSGKYDLVSGWKKRRYDGKVSKNIPSKIYNATARMVTGIKLHDMNCGIKAYRKEVIKSIEVYGDMHRYIPYLAKSAGFTRIGEKVVIHQARKYGKSKFGLNRFVNGYLDLLSLWFLSKFGKKPMHFFGLIGSLTFLGGFICSTIIIVNKLVAQTHGIKYRAVTDQPLFYIALVALIVGMQLFLSGFLGEMVSRNSTERNRYLIDKRIE
ncbi:MAG: glycosyltransferase family 2 protein [Prevotellaceae bacterium]|jgi:glycosyltransferase involved in cell wall biosynthesis|nr:glycosyltransferase family 2 protein [Prevotellaceae bacterium]